MPLSRRSSSIAVPDKVASQLRVNRLHQSGALTSPGGNQIVRLSPALNRSRQHPDEGLVVIESVGSRYLGLNGYS